MKEINDIYKKLNDILYNSKFWVTFALISFFNFFMDLIVWELFNYFVPSWVVAFMSMGFGILCLFIWYLIELNGEII